MSLLDLILNEKIILITAGAALIPLLGAVVLVVVSAMGRRRRKRAASDPDLHALVDSTRAEATADGAPGGGRAGTGPLAGEQSHAAAPTVAPLLGSAEDDEQDEAPEEDEPELDEMQSMLLSVFAEEEEDGYYDMILTGLGNPPVEDIADLCDRVARQVKERGSHHSKAELN